MGNCCKTNMHLKQTGPTKTLPPHQHNITIHSQRRVSVSQGCSNGFLMLQVLKFKCCAGSAFYRGTFTILHHPSPSQLQTPAAQNMLQNKHAPDANWTNKNITSPPAQLHNTFPKKRFSVPRLFKRVPDVTGA